MQIAAESGLRQTTEMVCSCHQRCKSQKINIVQCKIRKVSSEKLKLFPETMGAHKGSGKGASGMDLSKISGDILEDECFCTSLEAGSSALKLLQLLTSVPSDLPALVLYDFGANSLGGGWPLHLYLYSED